MWVAGPDRVCEAKSGLTGGVSLVEAEGAHWCFSAKRRNHWCLSQGAVYVPWQGTVALSSACTVARPYPTCMHRGDWLYLNLPTGRLRTARERQAGALHSCTVCAVLTEGEQVQHPATAHPTACVWFGIFRKVCVGSVLCDAGRMPVAATRWVLELCCVQSCKTSSRDDSRVCICGMWLLTNCYFVAPCPYLSCAFHCRCGCVQLWIVLLCSTSVCVRLVVTDFPAKVISLAPNCWAATIHSCTVVD